MNLDFIKVNGLMPVIIQDVNTKQVLMLGYMNQEALVKTKETGLVCFYSRTKKRLWTKGESSGNYLHVISIFPDCDNDTLLIWVEADGPTCHLGNNSCFNTDENSGFIYKLQSIIKTRCENPQKESYTNKLVSSGVEKVAQKVGEEAVELVIEAMQNKDDRFVYEAADLIYHYLVLLYAKGFTINEIEKELKSRH